VAPEDTDLELSRGEKAESGLTRCASDQPWQATTPGAFVEAQRGEFRITHRDVADDNGSRSVADSLEDEIKIVAGQPYGTLGVGPLRAKHEGIVLVSGRTVDPNPTFPSQIERTINERRRSDARSHARAIRVENQVVSL